MRFHPPLGALVTRCCLDRWTQRLTVALRHEVCGDGIPMAQALGGEEQLCGRRANRPRHWQGQQRQFFLSSRILTPRLGTFRTASRSGWTSANTACSVAAPRCWTESGAPPWWSNLNRRPCPCSPRGQLPLRGLTRRGPCDCRSRSRRHGSRMSPSKRARPLGGRAKAFRR